MNLKKGDVLELPELRDYGGEADFESDSYVSYV